MRKTVQNVKNSLKFKALEKEGVLSVRVGVKKFSIPVVARMLTNSGYLFLSFPASSELYRINGKDLEAMKKTEDATDAFDELNPGKKPAPTRGHGPEMPEELSEALRNLPSGYRLGYSADGQPKLVRTRRRQPSE